jgi:hypothetical protein
LKKALTKVQVAQPPVRRFEEVPGVGVGVVKALGKKRFRAGLVPICLSDWLQLEDSSKKRTRIFQGFAYGP